MAKFQIEAPLQLIMDTLDLAEKSAKRGSNTAANALIKQGYEAIIKDLASVRSSIKEVK